VKDTVRLGRIGGVTVGLNWTLVAMVAVVASELADNRFSYDAPGHSGVAYALAGLLTAVGLLVGVLAHEMAHAFTARRFGLKVEGITLTWMGGVTRIQGEAERPGPEFLVAVVGPLASAAFGAALWGVHALVAGADNLVLAALGWLAVINVVLAVFNLIPASPLDGGRVLHAVMWALSRDRWKATRLSSGAGVGLGVAFLFGGFYLSSRSLDVFNGFLLAFLGWWVIASARAELSSGAVGKALDGLKVRDLCRPIGAAPGWITVRAFAEGYASARPGWVWLLEGWQGGYVGILVGDVLAGVPYHQWDVLRPVDLALPISASVGVSPEEDLRDALARAGGARVLIAVADGRSVGAVLVSDAEALVRGVSAGRSGPQGVPAAARRLP